jgi:hypothetical protein
MADVSRASHGRPGCAFMRGQMRASRHAATQLQALGGCSRPCGDKCGLSRCGSPWPNACKRARPLRCANNITCRHVTENAWCATVTAPLGERRACFIFRLRVATFALVVHSVCLQVLPCVVSFSEEATRTGRDRTFGSNRRTCVFGCL